MSYFKDSILPSQTGNSGKYLKTDGSTTSWNTVSGGSSSISQATIDFGTTPINEKSFSVTDATCTTSSKIILFNAGVAHTNENYGVQINLNYIPLNGSFTLTVDGGRELLRGQFIINYLITN